MKRTILILTTLLLTVSALSIYSATGTPSTLAVRTDANNYLLVTAVTQTNPVTQGVFASRTLRTDSTGSLQVVLTGTVTPTYPLSIPASTCAAPSLGESGAVTTGIAFTATPSILNCISGTARTTLTATSLTSTVPFLLGDGSVGAPSYSFASDTDTGWYRSTANRIDFAAGGVQALSILDGTLALMSDTGLFRIGVAGDAILARDAANTLAQRNGANNQKFRIGPATARVQLGDIGDGIALFTNTAETGFTRLIFGTNDSTGTALRNDAGGTLSVVTGNDGAWGSVSTGSFYTRTAGYGSAVTTGTLVTNDAQTVANAGVITIGDATSQGMVVITVDTDGVSAIINFRAGAAPIIVSNPDATFTITKDNAATVNVYFETGNYKLQNNRGASRSIRIVRLGV